MEGVQQQQPLSGERVHPQRASDVRALDHRHRLCCHGVRRRELLRFNLSEAGLGEARNPNYLRMAFGAILLFDGILQFQASMPLGLANNVVQPATAGTPGWLHSLMLHGISIWNSHAIALASAENTLFLVQNGPATAVNTSAPAFTLTDQHGASYSLGEHVGHYTLMTFLDPVCYTDCPLLAGQMKQVGAAVGPHAKLDLVAVAANPRHETMANVRSFIAKHSLGSVDNFYFVTGTLAHLVKVWGNFGIRVESSPTTIMSVHSDVMFLISPRGRIQWIIPDDPISNSSGENSAVTELITLLQRAGLK